MALVLLIFRIRLDLVGAEFNVGVASAQLAQDVACLAILHFHVFFPMPSSHLGEYACLNLGHCCFLIGLGVKTNPVALHLLLHG